MAKRRREQVRYRSNCILRNREPDPSGYESLIDVTIIEVLHGRHAPENR
jgi:hypothetical protein